MYQKLFYTDFTTRLCSAKGMIDFMLKAELALVKAQETNGIVPLGTESALEDIFKIADLSVEKLIDQIPLSGNAAAPLVKLLIAEANKENTAFAKYLHLGATSQDIVDTALILKIQKYIEWLKLNITALETTLIQLTKKHSQTVMIGRTLMQQARPTTFGLKTAKWLQGIRSAKVHLLSVENQLLCIQLGGAVGSQNRFLTKKVRQSFAEILALKDSSNWHTQRENIAAFASALGILSGSIGKIAKDITLLSQTEVGEVYEPAARGRGTSSTMPHKRNPILCAAILANVHRIPFLVATMIAAIPQSHERSAGLWHAEWETLDDLLGLTAGALEKATQVLDGLEVNSDRMAQNIELTKGLVFAETVALELAKEIGKKPAHDLIKQACKKTLEQGIHLKEVLKNMDLNLSNTKLNELFLPKNSIGQCSAIIEEILAQK